MVKSIEKAAMGPKTVTNSAREKLLLMGIARRRATAARKIAVTRKKTATHLIPTVDRGFRRLAVVIVDLLILL